jgi:protein arginine N-methyltransferase 2
LIFSFSLMAGYQPPAEDGGKSAEGDVLFDESRDIETDEGEFDAPGRALINAIFEYAPMEDVQRLLDEGAPLWFQDEDGWSALHAAASVEDAELVKSLLQRGALWNSGEELFHLRPSARENESLRACCQRIMEVTRQATSRFL